MWKLSAKNRLKTYTIFSETFRCKTSSVKTAIEIIVPPLRSSERDASKHVHVDLKISIQNSSTGKGHEAKLKFDLEESDILFVLEADKFVHNTWNSVRYGDQKLVFMLQTMKLWR